MAPRHTIHRLSDIDPDAVALALAKAIDALRVSVSHEVGVDEWLQDDERLRSTPIFIHACTACEYAVRGIGRPEHIVYDVKRAASSVVMSFRNTELLGLALAAAVARLHIEDGYSIDTEQMSALSGLHPSTLRRLREAGELTADGTPRPKAGTRYSAEESKRFLRARGVRGFSELW